MWFVWWVSQLWLTLHLWFPGCPRLQHTDKLFVLPWFSAIFVDFSLALNRRKDDKAKIKTEDIELEGSDAPDNSIYETINPVGLETGLKTLSPASICSEASSKVALPMNSCVGADGITKIYICTTMWHESPIEMMCMLKSVFRYPHHPPSP